MAIEPTSLGPLLTRLRVPLTLTWAGMIAERLVHAFWPLWTLCAAVAGVLMLGLHEMVPVDIVWALLVAVVVLFAVFAGQGLLKFRWPRRAEALARLDAALPGHPLTALSDRQVIGAGDHASRALWRAHLARMERKAAEARAVEPDLKLSRKDVFGLRYVALLGLLVALMFGSVWRVGSVTEMGPGGSGAALADTATWEGWIEPPAYTGRPSLYLNDLDGTIEAPVGSRVTLRFYGQVGALSLSETVSGRTEDVGAATDPDQSFDITRDGEMRIDGPNGESWQVTALPDAAPTAEILSDGMKTTFDGQMSQPFRAEDDYGVTGGTARFTLDLGAVDRRYGLSADPDPRDPIELTLPMPVAGDRSEFVETLIENLSQHAWAHLPVMLTLEVSDDAGQLGQSAPESMKLPARRFFDPVAASIIEQRRDLLWTKSNGRRVVQMLRAISHAPEPGLFRSDTAYLKLRVIMRRLDTLVSHGSLADETQAEIAEALWDLAVLLEDGDIGDALERMREAQERLSEAIKRGATDEEIAQLMQELRDATQDYLRQKSQQAQRETDEPDNRELTENMMRMDSQDLQDMMDRIQELMEQGRMAEAQQALEEFQEMMENLRVTEGQQGQGGESPGQQAMEGLAETLRDQQGLSDQAFRDLQEQFNPNAQAGESQGNQGRSGGQGQGQQHEGLDGQGEGEGQQRGGRGDPLAGDSEGSLADRQEALRRRLDAQRDSLPGGGSEAGEAARDALDRAGRAMDGAEEALRGNDMAEAIDRQSEAMEALREGMRNLGEALAENNETQGGQGQALGQFGDQQSDPLGRIPGRGGQVGTQDELLQGEDVYRRARELLDEIRRRSGEGERPEVERNYLRRLLDRF
ncbi:TIGR02302 family protein [Roseovarius faecimaris]|uniref:TIGR02302 family protein n=1 Tax=Roseovarius faecimaris TaxID=2494550 RepID=A0A6I6IN60_9RHOB|nr:TIGR02302 family protein [Roseovarius faecimaris]QGX97243.1 TIGR02302 family protein [Roseovarius faecimaris]